MENESSEGAVMCSCVRYKNLGLVFLSQGPTGISHP